MQKIAADFPQTTLKQTTKITTIYPQYPHLETVDKLLEI